MKRVIRFLEREKNVTDEWKGFLSDLRGIVTSKAELRDSHHFLHASSTVRQFLETHPQSNMVWSILKKKRSWIPSGLSGEQHEHLDKVRTNHPDIFLLTGNHLFLLVLATTKTIHHPTIQTHLVEELWDYVQPWQLVQLGLLPKYHDQHRTGESVLHRERIYESLTNRASMLGVLLEKMYNVSNVRFGQAIMVDSGMTGRSPTIWLSCQSKPGHHEMDIILLSIEEDLARGVEDVLRRFVRDKPFWGESDITRLSQYAEISPDSTRTPIMFAEQRGIEGLWVLNRTRQVWTPIGRVEYYIRKKETVTLIRSLTIRQDFSLQPIPIQDVRELPGTITDQMDTALEVIRVDYSKCIPVSCKVSIDPEEKMFIISFTDKQGLMDSENSETLQLLVKRTADVLEVLRRPDIECKSVNVSEKQLVWNRFKNIDYVGDAFLLKQWVERKDPYKYTSISLPPTAEHFLELSRTSGLKISVHHDASVCPLRNSSFEELAKRQKSSEGKVKTYLQHIEGHEGQPDNLFTESIYSHGLCWRVKVESEGVLPEDITSIEEIALKGPKLRTLLETGSLILQTNEDEWSVYDFDIPNPSELPREFRESIHLMGIRRRGQVVIEEAEEPMFPGTYIIEEWTPDIRLYLDRIEFKIHSQATEEVRTHMIFESGSEQMKPENLRNLLWNGMYDLVGEVDLRSNEHLFELVQVEIEEHVELAEDSVSVIYQYRGLGKKYDGAGGEVKTADFVTNEGEPLNVVVTQRIENYKDWTDLQGGIDPQLIENEVSEKLSKYDIEESAIEKVIEDVKNFLRGKKDVRLFEE